LFRLRVIVLRTTPATMNLERDALMKRPFTLGNPNPNPNPNPYPNSNPNHIPNPDPKHEHSRIGPWPESMVIYEKGIE
jgi:hypothetical protein